MLRVGGIVGLTLILVILLLRPEELPPDVLAYDRFDRSLAEGLGGIDRGGEWRLSGTKADYRVDSESAIVVVPEPGSTRRALLPDVTAADVDLHFLVGLETLPTGGGALVYSILRHSDEQRELRSRIRVVDSGAVYVGATLFSPDGEEELTPEVRLEETRWAPGTRLHLRTRVEGDPAVLRVKVWADGTNEPIAWTMRANTARGAVPPLGSIGFQAYVGRSGTTIPFQFRFDDYVARRLLP